MEMASDTQHHPTYRKKAMEKYVFGDDVSGEFVREWLLSVCSGVTRASRLGPPRAKRFNHPSKNLLTNARPLIFL